MSKSAAACPPLVTSYPGDPESLLVASASERGKWYRVRDVWGGFPTCECQGFANRRNCKHELAALEAAREAHKMTETSTAVAIRKPSALEQRTEANRISLASQLGGLKEAEGLAEFTEAFWPAELTKQRDDALALADPEDRMYALRKVYQTVAVVINYANLLQVPGLAAFSYITVIKGRPFLMARMIDAVIQQHRGCYIEIVSQAANAVTGRAYRPGRHPAELTITIGEAKTAGWTQKPGGGDKETWAKMPRPMLVARVKTSLGWQVYADYLVGMGVYDDESGETMVASDLERTPNVRVVEGAPVTPEPVAQPEEPAEAEYREVASEASPPVAPPSPPVSPRPQQPAVDPKAKAIDAALTLAQRDPWKGLVNLCTAYRMQAVALLGRLVVPKAELTFEKVNAMAMALEYGAALDEAEQWNGIIERYAAATGDAPAPPYQEPASDDENNPFD